MWYGKFYDMEAEVRCDAAPYNIYTLCGVDENEKIMVYDDEYVNFNFDIGSTVGSHVITLKVTEKLPSFEAMGKYPQKYGFYERQPSLHH